jgi:DNA end-binding protein Ku
MKTYCPADDAYIERSDTVRGYEFAPGQYVVVTDEDLAAVPLKTVRSIEIEQFVSIQDAAEKTRFVKQSYYLEPDPIARRAFYLLKGFSPTTACGPSARSSWGIASSSWPWTPLPRRCSSPAVLAGRDQERRRVAAAEDEAEVKPAERAMAEQLVAAMTTAFDPAAFHDEYREALLSTIEAKVAARRSRTGSCAAAGVTDLVAALEASVAAARAPAWRAARVHYRDGRREGGTQGRRRRP